MIPIPITVQIDPEKITDLIIVAIDGACNYWTKAGLKLFKGERNVERGNLGETSKWWGSSVLVLHRYSDDEENRLELYTDRPPQVVKGLNVMATKYPAWFAVLLTGEDYDDEIADVFIQCCLFGEIIYG